jgi:hypothetical protein
MALLHMVRRPARRRGIQDVQEFAGSRAFARDDGSNNDSCTNATIIYCYAADIFIIALHN